MWKTHNPGPEPHNRLQKFLTRKSAHTQNGILDPEMPKIW